MWQGMMVLLPERFWEDKFANLTPEELAATLTEISADVHHRLQEATSVAKARRTKSPVSARIACFYRQNTKGNHQS